MLDSASIIGEIKTGSFTGVVDFSSMKFDTLRFENVRSAGAIIEGGIVAAMYRLIKLVSIDFV